MIVKSQICPIWWQSGLIEVKIRHPCREVSMSTTSLRPGVADSCRSDFNQFPKTTGLPEFRVIRPLSDPACKVGISNPILSQTGCRYQSPPTRSHRMRKLIHFVVLWSNWLNIGQKPHVLALSQYGAKSIRLRFFL